jgi:hypothetical protein
LPTRIGWYAKSTLIAGKNHSDKCRTIVHTSTKDETSHANISNSRANNSDVVLSEPCVYIIPNLASANDSRLRVGIIIDLVKALHGDEKVGRRRETGVRSVTATFDLAYWELSKVILAKEKRMHTAKGLRSSTIFFKLQAHSMSLTSLFMINVQYLKHP